MALFQHSVLTTYLSGMNEKQADEAWDVFKSHFHHEEVQKNIREAKEESYQEGFLEDLFVKVLGYTKNPTPNYNLVVEQKNLTDSSEKTICSQTGCQKRAGTSAQENAAQAVMENSQYTTNLGTFEIYQS